MTAANCPAQADYDPLAAAWHDKPVNHAGNRIGDLHGKCLWDQLQWTREEVEQRIRAADDQYLLNLETEWSRRNLCSHCLRELDHPFMISLDEAQGQRDRARGKLTRIQGALNQQEGSELRSTLTAILAEGD